MIMNRKHFLSSALSAGIALPSMAANFYKEDGAKPMHIPRYLKTGDTIGITSPAGYILDKEVQPAIEQIESWGLKIKLGDTIGKRDNSFGGTDNERAADFQKMLDDPSLKAILCARGGYGCVRIIDKLNFKRFAEKPKWVIGFSDVTVLHSHIHNNYGIATLHSKMCNSFPDDWSKAEPVQKDTILSIQKALMGEKMQYTAEANSSNVTGMCSGILIGGNLKTLETLSGTRSDINTDGKILFAEDTGEYLYSIDRMFWNLKRTGKLNRLKGLIVGGFKIKPDDPGEEFGKTIEEIVLEKVKDFHYPVCFNFPVGHQKNNFALKCGVRHKLIVSPEGSSLTEVR